MISHVIWRWVLMTRLLVASSNRRAWNARHVESFFFLFLFLRRVVGVSTLRLNSCFQSFQNCSSFINAILLAFNPLRGHCSIKKLEKSDEIACALEVDGVLFGDGLNCALVFVSLSEYTHDKVFNVELQVVLRNFAHCSLHLLESP